MESVATDAAGQKKRQLCSSRGNARGEKKKEKHTIPLTSPRGANWLANAGYGAIGYKTIGLNGGGEAREARGTLRAS
eukprot:7791592-Pyramimonas_sp.AAC.1